MMHADAPLSASGPGAIGLDDRRFAPDNVRQGVWSPDVFRRRAQGGIYFVEDYDERRIPVLFIHGISGSPRDFRYLIERLDRWRLQPCVFFYASGAALHEVAEDLAEELGVLRATHGFGEILIVAHSMGGLIARDVLISGSHSGIAVPALVTISTPWQGHGGAAFASRFAPFPARTRHHLVFSYQRHWMSFGASNDAVVTVASQLSRSAREQAHRVYGFNATHTGILSNPAIAVLSGKFSRIFAPTICARARSCVVREPCCKTGSWFANE